MEHIILLNLATLNMWHLTKENQTSTRTEEREKASRRESVKERGEKKNVFNREIPR